MKPKTYLYLNFLLFFGLNLNAQKNCNLPNPGLKPIPDIASGTYRGFQGGLYSNGKNKPTGAYLSDALNFANNIKPLDINGNPSGSGKIVFAGVGASNPRTEFEALIRKTDTFSKLNSNLKLVNTCIGGQGVQKMNDPADNYWKTTLKLFDSLGCSFNQVQVVWIETDNTQSSDTVFPRAPFSLVKDLRILMETLKIKFPNLKLCYLSARAYSGWVDPAAGNTIGKGLLSPRDYYNGWAIKWLVDSASLQNPNYNYKGTTPKMALPLFGSYHYTNGSEASKDGFSFDCNTDVGGDGLHLTAPGEEKIGKRMFDFFRTDSVSKIWFLKSNSTSNVAVSQTNTFTVFPNPANQFVMIAVPRSQPNQKVQLLDAMGKIVLESTIPLNITGHKFNLDQIPNGVYFVKINGYNWMQKVLVAH